MENLFSALIGKAQSELFLFLILIAVVLAFVGKPMYKTVAEYRQKRKQQELDREGKLLDVISGNSSIMTELKVLLTSTNENCRTCRAEQMAYFKSFDNKQDSMSLKINDIEHNTGDILQLLKKEV